MIRLSVLTLAAGLTAMTPGSHAEAAEPPEQTARCTKADYTRGRRAFQKLFDARQYPEAVALLQRTRESCWDVLAPQDRGWLVSDLALAHLRAGQPSACLEILEKAPAELEPSSKVAKAIAFNRGRCEEGVSPPASESATGTLLPVQVLPRLELVTRVEDAPAALRREWTTAFELREEGKEAGRCSDTDGLRMRDFGHLVSMDYHYLEGQLLRCRAVKALLRARPSRTSHVRELLTMKSPGAVLPAVMAPTYAEPEPPSPQSRSWLAADPKLTFEQGTGPYDAFSLGIEAEAESGLLEWWATGDFNGDGQEDVLAYLIMRPEGGSLRDVSAYLLTRSQPQGVLQVLEHWKIKP